MVCVLVQILILSNLSLAEQAFAKAGGAVVALMTFLCVCITRAGGRVVIPKGSCRTLLKILRQTVDEGQGINQTHSGQQRTLWETANHPPLGTSAGFGLCQLISACLPTLGFQGEVEGGREEERFWL